MPRITKKYHSLINDETPISALNLSLRYYNGLRRYGVNLIKDLVVVIEDDHLHRVRFVGDKGRSEILEKLDHYFQSETTPENVNGGPQQQLQEKQSPVISDTSPIDTLNLSIRVQNALLRQGIEFVGELIFITEKNLLSGVRNLGKAGKDEIIQKLDVLLENQATSSIDKESNSLSKEIRSLKRNLEMLRISSRWWEILYLRAKGITLQEAGQELNVSRERIRQMEKEALERFYSKIYTLSPFFDLLEKNIEYLPISYEDKLSIEEGAERLKTLFDFCDENLISLDVAKKTLVLLRFLVYSENETHKTRWKESVYKACSLSPYVSKHDQVVEKIETEKKKYKYEDLALEVLQRSGVAMHWKDIAEQAESLNKRENFNTAAIYNMLQAKKNIFVRVDQGTYGLAKWGLQEAEYYVDIIAKRGCKISCVNGLS